MRQQCSLETSEHLSKFQQFQSHQKLRKMFEWKQSNSPMNAFVYSEVDLPDSKGSIAAKLARELSKKKQK